MGIGQKALELHRSGHNCAQSVVCAFADRAGIDKDTVFRAAEGFGFGMGNGEQVCVAVSGAAMACGICKSSGKPDDIDSRIKSLGRSKQITEAFREKNGFVICEELRGMESGKVLRTCPECIADATRLAEEIILKEDAAEGGF